MADRTKRVLVTGSNGLLGQKLVALLQTRPGYEVIATARGENRFNSPHGPFEYYSLDITNSAQVFDLLSTLAPDYVVNTAAMTNVDQCETERKECRNLNVDSVSYLAEACAALNVFLLHLSTDFIFDGINGPYDEQAEALPLSFYGQSKLDAEEVLINSPLKWAIARTVLVYGIAQDMSRTNIILWVKKSLEDGKTINVVDDQWRTPTLAEDLALGCFLILKHDATGIFNISGKDFLTPYEMAIATANYFNLDKSLINKTDGSKFTQPAKRPPRTGFIIDKARNVLGYEPHSFDEGIAELAKQLKS
ncbi:MAG: SDR family oxidoreductase [Bacteroidota bacterium]